MTGRDSEDDYAHMIDIVMSYDMIINTSNTINRRSSRCYLHIIYNQYQREKDERQHRGENR